MAAPRQGLNPTTNSVGFTAKLVTVRSVSADGSTAIVVDRQNTQTQVPMLVQRSKGPLPAAGDSWLISQDLGMWTFAAFIGTSGSDFADGGPVGSQVTIAPSPPASPVADDVWLNSANGNQIASWDGSAWVPAQFGASALAPKSVTGAQIADSTITSAQLAPAAGILASQVAFAASEIGGSRVFTGTAQPSGMVPGDLWFDAGSDNSVSVWTGEGWQAVPLGAQAIAPSSLTGAQLSDAASIAASQVDFTASDIGGVTVSISAAQPVGPAAGDLWYDSTDGYVLKQWNGSVWALYKYGTGAISAGAITAELIAANTITAAELAAGIIYAGIINGTIVTAATFIGSVFEGTDFILNTAGSFFYLGTPGLGNLPIAWISQASEDPYGNPLATSGIASYSLGTWVSLNGGQINFTNNGYISQNTNYMVFGGVPLEILTPLFSALDQVEPGTVSTPETWHSLGAAGSTGCTLVEARYKLSPDGNFTVIDILLEAGSGGSTAGTYTWSNTLPSDYQWPGSGLRVYQLPFNGNITTATENSVIVIDGSTGSVPGRVRMTIPAVPANTWFTGTCFVPIS